MGGEKGFNPHKQVKGRKRNILVDTLGLLLFVVVCAASIQDSDAAEYIVRETEGRFPRLRTILVDQGYAHMSRNGGNANLSIWLGERRS